MQRRCLQIVLLFVQVEFMAKQIEMGRKEFGEVLTEQNHKVSLFSVNVKSHLPLMSRSCYVIFSVGH